MARNNGQIPRNRRVRKGYIGRVAGGIACTVGILLPSVVHANAQAAIPSDTNEPSGSVSVTFRQMLRESGTHQFFDSNEGWGFRALGADGPVTAITDSQGTASIDVGISDAGTVSLYPVLENSPLEDPQPTYILDAEGYQVNAECHIGDGERFLISDKRSLNLEGDEFGYRVSALSDGDQLDCSFFTEVASLPEEAKATPAVAEVDNADIETEVDDFEFLFAAPRNDVARDDYWADWTVPYTFTKELRYVDDYGNPQDTIVPPTGWKFDLRTHTGNYTSCTTGSNGTCSGKLTVSGARGANFFVEEATVDPDGNKWIPYPKLFDGQRQCPYGYKPGSVWTYEETERECAGLGFTEKTHIDDYDTWLAPRGFKNWVVADCTGSRYFSDMENRYESWDLSRAHWATTVNLPSIGNDRLPGSEAELKEKNGVMFLMHGPDATINCKFVNERPFTKLNITKKVFNPETGQTETPKQQWSFTPRAGVAGRDNNTKRTDNNGQLTFDVKWSTVRIDEDPQDGYEVQDWSCKKGSKTIASGTGSQIAVDVVSDDVDCTIVNRPTAQKLTIVKKMVDYDGSSITDSRECSNFSFEVKNDVNGKTAKRTLDSSCRTTVDVAKGHALTLTESQVDGWDIMSELENPFECRYDNLNKELGNDHIGYSTKISNIQDDVTCTVYNQKREIKNSTIRVQKQLKKNGSNSYYPERDWQISVDSRDSSGSTWFIDRTDSNGWIQVNVDDPAAGYWMFTEFGDSTKTKFDSFSCSTGNRVQEGWNTNNWGDYMKGMQVEVTPGQNVECVFYNSELQAGPIVIDKYWEISGDSSYAGSYDYNQAKQKGFDVGLLLTVNGRETSAQFGYSYDLTQLGGGSPYSHGLNDDLKIEETNFVLPESCSLTAAVMESAPGYPNLNSSGWDRGGSWNVFTKDTNYFKLVNKVRCDATCPYQGFNVTTDKTNGTVTADGTSSYTVTAEVSGSAGDAQVRLTPTDSRLKVDGGTSAVTKTVNTSGRATWTITSTTSGTNLGYRVEVVSGKSGYDKCGYSKELNALFASEPQVCTASNSSLVVSPSPTTVDSSVTVTGKPVDAKGNYFPSGTKVTLSGYSGYLSIGSATATVGTDGTVKWSGTAIKQGSITLSMRIEGEAKDCQTATLTINAKPAATGKITINKQWWLDGKNQGYPLANTEIEITVNGTKVTPGQALTVEAGKDLVIKETVSKVPAGTYLSNKQIGVNNNSLQPLSDSGYTISGGVSADGQLSYVIVNDLKTEVVAPTKGSLRVSKQWQDTSGDALSGGSVVVTVAGTGYSQSKTIDGSASVTFEDVPAGSVTVTEGSYTAPGGYTYANTTIGGNNGLSATATVTANNTTNVSIVNRATKDAVEHSSTVYLKKYVCDAGQTSCQSDAKRADWSVSLQNVSGGSGATITNPGSKKTGGSGTGGATWSVKGVEGKTARVELSEALVGDTEFASLECHVDGGVAGGVADIKSATVSGGTAKVTFDVPVPPSGKNVDCYLYNRIKTLTPNPQLDVVYDMIWSVSGGGSWGEGTFSDAYLKAQGWPVTLTPTYNASSASGAYTSWGKWGDSKSFPKGQKLYFQEVQQGGTFPEGCSWDTSRGNSAHELVRDKNGDIESMHWLTLGQQAPGHVSVVDSVPNKFVVINYVTCEKPASEVLTVSANKTWRIAGELKVGGKSYTGDVPAASLAGVFDNKFKFAPRSSEAWPVADEIAWGATKSYQRGVNDANFARGFALSETVVSEATLSTYGCGWNYSFEGKPSQFTLEGQNYTRAFNGDTGALYGATNTDYVKGVDHLSFSIVNSIKCTPPTIAPTCPYQGLSFKISPTSASIEPGKSVAVTVTASKTAGSFDGLSAKLVVPAGFTINKGDTVDISGTGGVAQWTVTAPSNLNPGDYTFSAILVSSKDGWAECGISSKSGKLSYKVTEPTVGSVRVTKQWVDESGKAIAAPSKGKVKIWLGGANDYAGGPGSVLETITGNASTIWNKVPAGEFWVRETVDTYPAGYDDLGKIEWLVDGKVVATGPDALIDGVPATGGMFDVTVRNYVRAEAKVATVTVNKEWVDIDGVKVFSTAKNTGVTVTVGGVSCQLGMPCEVPAGTALVVRETITKIPVDGYDFVKAELDGKDLPEAGLSIGELTAGSSKTVTISNYLRKHAENVTSTMYLKKYVCGQGETTCTGRADWQVGASSAAGGTGASVADLDSAKWTGTTGNGATWKITGPEGSTAQVKLWEVAQGDKEFASLKCTDTSTKKVVLEIVGGAMPTKAAPTKPFEVTAGHNIDCYLYNREPAPDTVVVTANKTWRIAGELKVDGKSYTGDVPAASLAGVFDNKFKFGPYSAGLNGTDAIAWGGSKTYSRDVFSGGFWVDETPVSNLAAYGCEWNKVFTQKPSETTTGYASQFTLREKDNGGYTRGFNVGSGYSASGTSLPDNSTLTFDVVNSIKCTPPVIEPTDAPVIYDTKWIISGNTTKWPTGTWSNAALLGKGWPSNTVAPRWSPAANSNWAYWPADPTPGTWGATKTLPISSGKVSFGARTYQSNPTGEELKPLPDGCVWDKQSNGNAHKVVRVAGGVETEQYGYTPGETAGKVDISAGENKFLLVNYVKCDDPTVNVTVTKTWQVEGGSVLGDYSNKNATINVTGGSFSKLGQSFEVKKGSAVTVTETGYDVPDGYEFVKLTIDGASRNVNQAYSKTVNENATISVVNYVKKKSAGTASVKVTKDWVISGQGLIVDGTHYKAGTYSYNSEVGKALGSKASYQTQGGANSGKWVNVPWGDTSVINLEGVTNTYWTEVDNSAVLSSYNCSWNPDSNNMTSEVKMGTQSAKFNPAASTGYGAWLGLPSESGTTTVAYTNNIKCETPEPSCPVTSIKTSVSPTNGSVEANGVSTYTITAEVMGGTSSDVPTLKFTPTSSDLVLVGNAQQVGRKLTWQVKSSKPGVDLGYKVEIVKTGGLWDACAVSTTGSVKFKETPKCPVTALQVSSAPAGPLVADGSSTYTITATVTPAAQQPTLRLIPNDSSKLKITGSQDVNSSPYTWKVTSSTPGTHSFKVVIVNGGKEVEECSGVYASGSVTFKEPEIVGPTLSCGNSAAFIRNTSLQVGTTAGFEIRPRDGDNKFIKDAKVTVEAPKGTPSMYDLSKPENNGPLWDTTYISGSDPYFNTYIGSREAQTVRFEVVIAYGGDTCRIPLEATWIPRDPNKLDCDLSRLAVDYDRKTLWRGEEVELWFQARATGLTPVDVDVKITASGKTFGGYSSLNPTGPWEDYGSDVKKRIKSDTVQKVTFTALATDSQGNTCEKQVDVDWVQHPLRMDVQWQYLDGEGEMTPVTTAESGILKAEELPADRAVAWGQTWTSTPYLKHAAADGDEIFTAKDAVKWKEGVSQDGDGKFYLRNDKIAMRADTSVVNESDSTACKIVSSKVIKVGADEEDSSPNFVEPDQSYAGKVGKPSTTIVYTVMNTVTCPGGVQMDSKWFYDPGEDGSVVDLNLDNQMIVVADDLGIEDLFGQTWTATPMVGSTVVPNSVDGNERFVAEWGKVKVKTESGFYLSPEQDLHMGVVLTQEDRESSSKCSISQSKLVKNNDVLLDPAHDLQLNPDYTSQFTPVGKRLVDQYHVENVISCSQPTPGEGQLKWQKVDAANAETRLGGSEWVIVGAGADNSDFSLVVTDCIGGEATTGQCQGPDEDPGLGSFLVTLPEGEYLLRETEAPLGFKLNETQYPFTVVSSQVVTPQASWDEGKIPNERVNVSVVLPLTGEKSLLIILLGGLALIGVAIWSRRSAGKDTIRV